MKDNFFLLDVMGTDNSHLIAEYLKISEESVDLANSYYKLHNFSLANYKRRFAIIDHRTGNIPLWDNKEYWCDLEKRINFLKKNNFVFILGQQWEFVENMESFPVQKKYLDILKNVDYLIWNGDTDWFWFYLYSTHKNNQFHINHSVKTKDFLYLNKRSRPHRKKLFNELTQKNILGNSIVSFMDKPFQIRLEKKYEVYNNSEFSAPGLDEAGVPLPYVMPYGSDHEINELCYNDSVASIVSESTISQNKLFLSEKIWKPIIARQIFLVHGQPFTLKTLRAIGFETFDNFFDESYDVELNEDIKIQKISNSCKQILQLDHNDLYKKTVEIRNHNYQLFFNQKKIQKVISNKVLQFFKFFDSSQISS